MFKAILLLLLIILSGCGTDFMLCGDRGVQQWWTMGHGVKCTGDIMCDNQWIQSSCCCHGKICKSCGGTVGCPGTMEEWTKNPTQNGCMYNSAGYSINKEPL